MGMGACSRAFVTRYSTFWPRFWAGIVDAIVFLPLGLLDRWLLDPARPAAVLLAWAALSYSAFWMYSVILHARYGQTLGKMATGAKVLDVSEESIPSLRQAFVRDIGNVVMSSLAFLYLAQLVLSGRYATSVEVSATPSSILVIAAGAWFLLEVVTMLTNKKHRALHDFIARTVVVKDA